LISWQCKKQTMVANFTTKAEYIATSNYCGQVLWIQNQLMDYGYNFMHTKIHIDNESTICIVKNPIFHSKIKHIEIRHHFIKDSNKKKLIQMIKIHTDKNVADLLTKAFDVNLQLEDAKGIECLPNADIFEQLALMSAKSTAWNEFSSTMASTITCLATNQKFNFSKYIFDNMMKNLDNAGKFLMYPRRKQRKDTDIPQSSVPIEPVANEAVYEERDDSLERATPNELGSIETSFGGGPRRQETMEDTIAQTRSENVSKISNDPLLSGEDSLKLNELMDFCTKLQQRILDLENTKTAQAQEITSLKKRVKKLEKKKKSRTHRLRRLYKVGLSARIVSLDDEA
ncbi:hypothetical protein Tco_1434760, partial [Tanacetum coccineum]